MKNLPTLLGLAVLATVLTQTASGELRAHAPAQTPQPAEADAVAVRRDSVLKDALNHKLGDNMGIVQAVPLALARYWLNQDTAAADRVIIRAALPEFSGVVPAKDESSENGSDYVAIRAAGGGYQITGNTFTFNGREVGRKVTEIEEKNGHFLELNDLWSPVVIQMGRAADYKSFEAFQASVKARKFEYENGKLTYESEAKDRYEYWAKGAQLPKINGATVNLNPLKTYDSPYLSMEHGSNKAVIKYPGYDNVVLEF